MPIVEHPEIIVTVQHKTHNKMAIPFDIFIQIPPLKKYDIYYNDYDYNVPESHITPPTTYQLIRQTGF